mmetsp:Transcript_76845/g.207346  ORF Transcript_76845/g.207346 Transcript_76845/m.207346 type:complete len:791 (+) Transcript_76845:2477-4849(+)
MPRRLRRWARTIMQTRQAPTVSAERPKPDAQMQIDLTSARDRERERGSGGSKALVAGSGSGTSQKASDGAAEGSRAVSLSTSTGEKTGGAEGSQAAGRQRASGQGVSLEERKQEWSEHELAVRRELEERESLRKEIELNTIAEYLATVEERDKASEEAKIREREKYLAEVKARRELEAKLFAEEEAALAARKAEEEKKLDALKSHTDRKLDKFKKAQEQARKKKLASDAHSALKALDRCTALVEMECGRGGTCKLQTAAALRSPDCVEAKLEQARRLCEDSGLEGDERAQKVIALLYERRLAEAEAEKHRKAAEQRLAKALEGDTDLSSVAESLQKARSGLESIGATDADPSIVSVKSMEDRLVSLKNERAARAEVEMAKKIAAAETAINKCRVLLNSGNVLEARNAHGLASTELSLAGAADHRLSKDLALLLTQIENAEVENAKAQHVKEAERIKRLLEEAETLREEANQAQKSESWDQALEKLAKALSACKSAAGSSNEKDDPSSKCSQDVEKDVTAVHGARKSAEAAKAAEEREALLQAAVEEEAIRQRKEQEESERIEKERQENERLAKEQEEARKLASEQAEAQRLAKAQADKAAKADADKAAIAREEAEKTASQTGRAASDNTPSQQGAAEPKQASDAGPASPTNQPVPNVSLDVGATPPSASSETQPKPTDGGGKAAQAGVGMGVRPVYESPPKAAGGAQKQVGLEVSRLVESGPAASDGRIRVGDRLETVDGKDVREIPVRQLAVLLAGSPGTTVRLGLSRAPKEGGTPYHVELQRGIAVAR